MKKVWLVSPIPFWLLDLRKSWSIWIFYISLKKFAIYNPLEKENSKSPFGPYPRIMVYLFRKSHTHNANLFLFCPYCYHFYIIDKICFWDFFYLHSELQKSGFISQRREIYGLEAATHKSRYYRAKNFMKIYFSISPNRNLWEHFYAPFTTSFFCFSPLLLSASSNNKTK